MCLYPKLIINKKYIPNKKNKGIAPEIKDPRTKYVAVGCGKCMECKKQKKMQWQIRLQEEIRTDRTGEFVTLSFSEESLIKLDKDVQALNKNKIDKYNEKNNTHIKYTEISGYDLDNEIATLAVRRYLERWRKENTKSVKHWLVTELGQTNTERLHIHGIIFGNKEQIIKHWQYGNVWIGTYVNERTVNYIVKYINKTDLLHKNYNPIVLTSSGIGRQYTTRSDSKTNKFKGKDTDETYKTRQGLKLALPKYYRNKLYNDDEKEQLWLNLLDKEIRYVGGVKVDVSNDETDYEKVRKYMREVNKRLGYGGDSKTEDELKYEQQRRNIKKITREQKYLNNLNSFDE